MSTFQVRLRRIFLPTLQRSWGKLVTAMAPRTATQRARWKGLRKGSSSLLTLAPLPWQYWPCLG
ncbi:hypothetical protein IF1G_05855 [Cordyceps javanica]|uniref:Uncharacterized protein n=1 Tax=Cordyceps javanica TaxID=43265 RepID=A0A545V2T3_9HYPO|nr:hypothetical protein IF1G_05855 [Cordyceps javanica]